MLNDIKAWANEISPEDLPEPYRTLSYQVGINVVITIAELYQGAALYLPKLDSTLALIRDRKIREEFNGYNYRELALKYRLTERWVREIVENEKKIDQISIFDIQKENIS